MTSISEKSGTTPPPDAPDTPADRTRNTTDELASHLSLLLLLATELIVLSPPIPGMPGSSSESVSDPVVSEFPFCPRPTEANQPIGHDTKNGPRESTLSASIPLIRVRFPPSRRPIRRSSVLESTVRIASGDTPSSAPPPREQTRRVRACPPNASSGPVHIASKAPTGVVQRPDALTQGSGPPPINLPRRSRTYARVMFPVRLDAVRATGMMRGWLPAASQDDPSERSSPRSECSRQTVSVTVRRFRSVA